MSTRTLPVVGCLCLALLGCTGPGAPGPQAPSAPDLGPSNPLVAARPYDYRVPAGYDAARPAPLVIVLHGYGVNGATQDAFFGMCKLADEKGALCAYPDGTPQQGELGRYWNATDQCCGPSDRTVDDVAYIDAIISDMKQRFSVDQRRVFLIGHSNGGFMSYRMACDRSEHIAAIVSLAGASWKDPQRCQPKDPVAVLQIHGDMDELVPYAGGIGLPSAEESVRSWAAHDGCAQPPADGPPRDLETSLPGAETAVKQWTGCQGGAAELWTIRGGAHVPRLQPGFAAVVYDFMTAHPKP